MVTFSKYVPPLVAHSGDHMSKFVSRISRLVMKECKIAIFIKDIDFSWLMTYA